MKEVYKSLINSSRSEVEEVIAFSQDLLSKRQKLEEQLELNDLLARVKLSDDFKNLTRFSEYIKFDKIVDTEVSLEKKDTVVQLEVTLYVKGDYNSKDVLTCKIVSFKPKDDFDDITQKINHLI